MEIDRRYFRPTEVESLLGDPTKANKQLGWKAIIPFVDMVKEMVQEDLKLAEKDEFCRREGFPTFMYNE